MQGAVSEKSQILKELTKKEFVRQYEKESVTTCHTECGARSQRQVHGAPGADRTAKKQAARPAAEAEPVRRGAVVPSVHAEEVST